jgi:hypothetical protein
MARDERFTHERPLDCSITNAVPASRDALPDCPFCGAEMEAGQVAVHTIFWRWLTLGESAPDCWFQSCDDRADEILVPAPGSRPALRCRRCQSVLIPGRGFQTRQGPAKKVAKEVDR